VTSAPTHRDRAPQPPAPDPAPAAASPPQRPTPVRDALPPPREDPGPIATSVRVVGTTTTTTVENTRNAVSEAVPALPKRRLPRG
jgi:hypothetical protein